MERGGRVNGGDYFNQVDRSAVSPPPSGGAAAGDGNVSVGVGDGGVNYIEHPVSKLDTLAGVAIRYGVEVADIKKMNGLVTDLQMFALKTLQIPLPGRHPPSPILSNGVHKQGPSSSEQPQPNRRHSDLFDSLQSLKLKPSPQRKVSPAMSSLQDYYGITPADRKSISEGFEMAVYRKAGFRDPEDGSLTMSKPISNQPLGLHGKSKSAANGFMAENGDSVDHALTQNGKDNDSDSWAEKLVRRRQKSDADFSGTPEMLMKEDNSSGGGGFSAKTGKGLALRPKASLINPIPIGLGDSLITENLSGVRKSSSTSSLQDSDSSTLASLWPTSKWSLKPDFQGLSTASITKPIFDGLPKPITGRRNKAALD